MREVLVLRDLECIKAIAHPKRIDILKAFNNLPLSAKQLSQMLDEPHAKINYHIKTLYNVGILELVEEKIKSGIVEKYYYPKAKNIVIDKNVINFSLREDDDEAFLSKFDDIIELFYQAAEEQVLEEKNIKIFKTTNKIFNELIDTENTQGILAVLRYKERDLVNNINQDDKFVLILDRIQDPGNMGTIIRTADSAGVDAIILLKGCVDIYNPKVIRSTMGSIFDMNIIQTTQDEAVDFLKANNFDIVSSYLHTESYYNETTYDGKIALVIGNEANGINDELISKSDKLVKIPIYGNAESLNAAISAAILMYEIKKYLV